MFTIRQEIEDRLAAGHRHSLAVKMSKVLQENFRDACEEPLETIVPQVETQMQNAARYGLTSELDACVYALTAWVTGAAFDTHYPAARSVLNSAISSEEKSRWLYDWMQAMIHTLGQPS